MAMTNSMNILLFKSESLKLKYIMHKLLTKREFIKIPVPELKKKSANPHTGSADFHCAQREGFEPPWGCPQTVFKTASL